ncbi:MAG: S41 family peptidase [Saprospiraceae bacterium]
MLKPIHLLFFLLLTGRLSAQSPTLDAGFKAATVQQLTDRLNAAYVFPDVAQKTGEHLQQLLQAGQFDQYTDLSSFADALTREAQSIAKDKHLRIRPAPVREAPAATPERLLEDKLADLSNRRAGMAGFRSVQRLDHNIGYFDLRGFAGLPAGKPVADQYMGLLDGVDALIIDLRKNGGGSPGMVQYLCSYFFDTPVHLNSLYWREGDRTEDFWTLDQVGGRKMPDVPIFILTSNYTFSGAEEFCYNMQTRKRATLVGETTGGGANPGGVFPLNEALGVFIPTGRAINPVTKTNWEGTGVVPEVKTTAAAAYDKALELAAAAADGYRAQAMQKQKLLLGELMSSLEQYAAGQPDEPVLSNLKKCLAAGLLTEDDVNALGYEYLQRFNKPATSVVIFKGNTLLHPGSANVYDSYGEALLATGRKDEARKIYQKAVELAEANKDPNLELFRRNLQAVDEKRP